MAVVDHEWSVDNPVAIVGTLDTGLTITIELWEEGVDVVITSDVCVEIEDTGRYTWSTLNLGFLTASRVQYQWRMSDGGANVNEVDIVFHAPAG